MGKKKNVTEATTEIPTSEAPVEVQTETAGVPETPPEPPPPKKSKAKKKVPNVTTLADLAAAYAVQMEEDGKSGGTIASYGMELRVAQGELGETTPLADLTPERVSEFFNSKREMKLKSGKATSQLSIDKTRRVLRLALVWAAERGIIAKAPIPGAVEAK
jgi:hypothetical protein